MCVQLLTAVGALTGCVLSLYAADADELANAASSSWVYYQMTSDRNSQKKKTPRKFFS